MNNLIPITALGILLCSPLCVGGEDAGGQEFTAEDRAWWAVQAVADPAVPGSGHPVDAFVERKRGEAKLTAAPAAGAVEFVRRAYFDLHGLPPTPAQVDAFVSTYQTDADKAVAALVEELLASPRYGERWAQHWLDVVRFAESDGYREDAFRPDAHRYRDYVIRAFNEDKPYDQFVREQLAADEFAAHDPATLEATGFLRLGIYEWNQRNAEMQRELMVDEITNLTGEVFLGVGIGCAKCHDHKFDPLLQRDYFALQAFLSSTAWPTDRKLGTPEQLAAHAAWVETTAARRAEIDSLLAEERNRIGANHVKTFPENVQAMYWKAERERSSYEQQIAMLVQRQVDREEANVDGEKILAKDPEKLARYHKLKAELAEFDKSEPKLPTAFVSTDTGPQPAITYLNHDPKHAAVEPAYLSLLGAPAPVVTPTAHTTGRRSALADWITRADNPLAARVYANRLWQYHFGKGLVATPNDFGTLGAPPSHPELLDWLAARLVEGGWKIKPLHRLIMTSATYRQTARREPGEQERRVDPGNRLLWRFPPARLSAEQVRDAMLAVSGELRQRDGGASVDGASPQRSIYVKKLRNSPDPVLGAFDAPSGFDSAPTRQQTNTPTQSLLLTNNPWPLKRARAFALRLLAGKKEIDHEAIAAAYRSAWGRTASGSEIELALNFVRDQAHGAPTGSAAAPDRFPGENGLRPIAQRFGAVSGIPLGEKALWLQPGSRFERLQIAGAEPVGESFTIEAVLQLEAIHADAKVNPILARWDGDMQHPGWSFGVTSAASNFGPRNLVLELNGTDSGGNLFWEAVASGLRVPLATPVYVAATVELHPQGRGSVRFFFRDLSKPDAELRTAEVGHSITAGIHRPESKLMVGGRQQKGHLWDGQLAALRVSRAALAAEQLLVSNPSAPGERLLDWTFGGNDGEQPAPRTRWLRPKPPQPDHGVPLPVLAAMTDFCHALLSSNEFLYLH